MEVLQDLFYVLLHVLLWSLLNARPSTGKAQLHVFSLITTSCAVSVHIQSMSSCQRLTRDQCRRTKAENNAHCLETHDVAAAASGYADDNTKAEQLNDTIVYHSSDGATLFLHTLTFPF